MSTAIAINVNCHPSWPEGTLGASCGRGEGVLDAAGIDADRRHEDMVAHM